MEYFACPDGTRSVCASSRPEPLFSTFILSGAGESGEQYGVCLTIFTSIQCDNKRNKTAERIIKERIVKDNDSVKSNDGDNDNSSQKSPISNENSKWWQSSPVTLTAESTGGLKAGASLEGVSEKKREMKIWTGVTLCIVSRWPLVQQLQQCLLYLYHSSLLPSLLGWEDRCRALMEEYSVRLSSRETSTMTRDGNECDTVEDIAIDSMYLVMEPLLLTGQCIEMLTKLCLEYPVPLWGIFSLDVTLPAINRITSYDSNFDNGEIHTYIYLLTSIYNYSHT